MDNENSTLTAARKFEAVCKILEGNNYDHCRLIPILQAIQEEYRYLPEKVLTYVASSLRISPAKVFGVATFYSHFALQPKGKYIIKVCDGTACHVKESIPIVEEIQKKLKLTPENRTTEDMMFTLETVSCLGACGLAPVVVVNDQVYSQMTPAKASDMIDEILKKEAGYDTATN